MGDSDVLPSGLVVASYGRRGILETESGKRLRFVLKGRRLRAVCGDMVSWDQQADNGEVRVTAIRERRNQLSRINSRGQTEILASNLDQLLVVAATTPPTDFFLVDRYLCAAALMNITARIVWNKTDLQADESPEITEYARIGYGIIPTSVVTGTGTAELSAALEQRISMLVGQSGVGKSSLINSLVPGADVAVGEVSESTREGRHTTTASIMHSLPGGGRLIDSPGVREFQPAIDATEHVQQGFPEIVTFIGQCRFSDCRHDREPDCAVKAAVAAGGINGRRYESYRRIRRAADAD